MYVYLLVLSFYRCIIHFQTLSSYAIKDLLSHLTRSEFKTAQC